MSAPGDTPPTIGSGEYRYEIHQDWAKLPPGYRFGDVAAVATDRQDRVYVFNRGEHPMIVLDRDGNFLRSWGESLFRRAHGLHMGPDETLYCTDEGDHTVKKCTLDGKLLLVIGVPGEAAPYMSGRPFHRCTHTALAPDGDLYVADGYGNACVHKYAPDGRRLASWGKPGCGPGEFNIPHQVCCDRHGWVYVADRENHRVQVFDGDGRYETEWHHLHRPNGMYMDAPDEQQLRFYIGENGPQLAINRRMPNLGPRITILDDRGRILARLGIVDDPFGQKPGQFLSPHGLCVDAHGDIYVGEVSYTAWGAFFPNEPMPSALRCLQKFVRVPASPSRGEAGPVSPSASA